MRGGAKRAGGTGAQSFSGREYNRLFTRQGDRFFQSQFSAGLGFAYDARTVVPADLDNDGDLDLVIRNLQNKPIQLLRNSLGPVNHAATVRLQQKGSNNRAIGASMHAQCGDASFYRHVHAGYSFLAQKPFALHVGLGECNGPLTLTVTWPDGAKDTYSDLPVDHVLTITRGQSHATQQAHQRRSSLASNRRPDIQSMLFPTLSGAKAGLFQFAKTPYTIVNIWAPWCSSCKKEIPLLKKWANANREEYTVVYLSLQMDDVAAVRKAAHDLGIENTTVVGTTDFFEQALGGDEIEIPMSIVFDKNAVPQKQLIGPQRNPEAYRVQP